MAALLPGLHLRFSGANVLGGLRRDRAATAWRSVLEDDPVGGGVGALVRRRKEREQVQGRGGASTRWRTILLLRPRPKGLSHARPGPVRLMAGLCTRDAYWRMRSTSHAEAPIRGPALCAVRDGWARPSPCMPGRPHAGAASFSSDRGQWAATRGGWVQEFDALLSREPFRLKSSNCLATDDCTTLDQFLRVRVQGRDATFSLLLCATSSRRRTLIGLSRWDRPAGVGTRRSTTAFVC